MAGGLPPPFILGQKEGGIGQAEAVDALFHIPYQKKIVVPFYPINDGFLHQVAVLVFIYENKFKFATILGGYLGIGQNSQGEVLQIIEINQALVGFLRLISSC